MVDVLAAWLIKQGTENRRAPYRASAAPSGNNVVMYMPLVVISSKLRARKGSVKYPQGLGSLSQVVLGYDCLGSAGRNVRPKKRSSRTQ